MPTPVLSVIIPTHARSHLLRGALDSALAVMEVGIEVIVVPNGPDPAWKTALAPYATDRRVRIEPIEVAHGNAARNHGMALARGRYLRFLDDDDLLYPDGVREQLAAIESSSADVVSAPIELLREDGTCFRTVSQPGTSDFIAGVMRHDRLLQVTAHLFRRDWVQATQWNETIPYAQDMDWMFRLCHHRDPRWRKTAHFAGGWRRHTGARTTTQARLHHAKQLAAEGILELVASLRAGHRLTDERRAAAAAGLWECVHSALFMSSRYWSNIATVAEALHPGSHPDTRFFRSAFARRSGLTPLQWERLLSPKRSMTYGLRRALLALRISRTW
jgi:glycosyltransferase involved in cell wall biosynthesis